jgi:hypothetical protein
MIMNNHHLIVLLTASFFATAIHAQTPDAYQVPRTEHGQPDIQGVWGTRFSTMLERPPGMPLVLAPEQAAGFAEALAQGVGDNTDPDIDMFGPPVLAVVNFRSPGTRLDTFMSMPAMKAITA